MGKREGSSLSVLGVRIKGREGDVENKKGAKMVS
jgi:hypothetical protein